MDRYISDAVVKREREEERADMLIADGWRGSQERQGRKEGKDILDARLSVSSVAAAVALIVSSCILSSPLPFPSIPFSNSLLRSLIQFLQLVSFSHSSLLSNYSIL